MKFSRIPNKPTNLCLALCSPLITRIYFWSKHQTKEHRTKFSEASKTPFDAHLFKSASQHSVVWKGSFVRQRRAPSQSQARCFSGSTKWSLRVYSMSRCSAVWGQSVAQCSHCDNSSQVVLISAFTSVGKEGFIMRICLKMKQFPTSTRRVFAVQLPAWTSSLHVSIIFSCLFEYFILSIFNDILFLFTHC